MGQIMTSDGWKALFSMTIRTPEAAARVVLGLGLVRVELLLSLTLMTVLNAIVFSVFFQLSSTQIAASEIFPAAYQSPTVYALLTGGMSVLTVIALLWSGRALGGRGTLDGIFAVITWLQVLRLAVQTLVLVLLFIMPTLAGILAIIGNLWGIWILINFIKVAHEFSTIGRAATVLIMAVMTGLFGLTLIVALIGGAARIGGVG